MRVHHAFGYFGRNKKPKAKMTTTCPDCHEPFRIAPSKRLQICPNCASIERTGKSIKEIAREKSRASLEKSRLKSQERHAKKPKTTYKIPKQSVKGKQQAKEVEATKRKLKRGAKQDGFTECQGCGKFVKQIEGSHKIPLSRSIALASKEENIRLLCGECHPIWEHFKLPEVVEIDCFLEDFEYLHRVDYSRFCHLLQKILDYYEKYPTPKLERVLGKIEKFET